MQLETVEEAEQEPTPIQGAKRTGRAGNSFQWPEPRQELSSCPYLVALLFHLVQETKALFLRSILPIVLLSNNITNPITLYVALFIYIATAYQE
jgi:hypothetical protein